MTSTSTATAWLLACCAAPGLAANTTSCPGGWNLYVANQGSASVAQFVLDPDGGQPIALDPPTVAAGELPSAIALGPGGRHAYITNLGADEVMRFGIDPGSGGLSPLKDASVATGAAPMSMLLHPNGRSAYVSNNGDDTLSQYAVDPSNGALTPLQAPTVWVRGNYPAGLALAASGRQLYVANLRVFGRVSQFSVAPADGSLAALPTPTAATCSSPVALALAPDGDAAWVACADLSLDDAQAEAPARWAIGQLRIAADGSLQPLHPASVEAAAVPSALVVTPDGRFLYAAGAEDGVIASYRVGTDGRLAPLPTQPVPSGKWTSALALRPDGRQLYALGLHDDSLWQYAVDPDDGSLHPRSVTHAHLGRPLALAIGCRNASRR